ncbi:MAG: VWA domain-containing protein [Rhodothermales bacterium]|nr:VWA domain-containing protein [Rhodothermales bacterium]
MTFLNPLFLIGLAAAAIPLIIHLFNFRRPRRVDFSSLAFLHELKRSTMQRVRIKQWLLLALRTLAIACLVLSFARPTLEGDLAGAFAPRGRTTSAIVIDNSTSMSLRDGGGAFVEQARTIAARLIEDVRSGDEVYVVPVQGGPRTPGSLPAYQNAEQAIEALLDIEVAHGTADLESVVRSVRDRVDGSVNLNRVVYVLSDFQAATLTAERMGRDGLAAAADPEESRDDRARVVLVPVGTEAIRNVAVTDVSAVSRIIAEGQPATIEATFLNAGDQDAEGVVASVFLGGERVARSTVDIPAGSTARTEFIVTPRSRGWLQGRVEIDDTPYQFDDVRRFTLHVPEQRSILIAGGTADYLELALSSELMRDRVRFDARVISESALPTEQLGAYDVVVLSAVRDLSSGERAALGEYVKGGGGLLVFPGRDLAVSDYNDLFGILGGGRFIGASDLGGGEGVSGAAVVGTFGRVDTEHPLFEGMFEPDPSGDAPTLEQPSIFRLTEYVPAGSNEQALIELTGGEPFLQEIRSGEGAVLIFGVSPDIRDSDLPVRGLFIPLLYRSLYYLSSTGSTMGNSVEAGDALSVRLPGVVAGASVRVLNEDGEEFLPDQRRVPGAVLADLRGPYFRPGYYEVTADGDRQRVIVVQPPAAESDLRLVDRDDLADRFVEETGIEASVLRVNAVDEAALERRLAEARTGVELWNVFLALALGFLLLEMLVARQWRPEAA